MNPIPFVSHRQFEETEPCALFPIRDYDICKIVWETSPLVEAICREMLDFVTEDTRQHLSTPATPPKPQKQGS